MNTLLGTSWRTTLIGYVGAALIAIVPFFESSGVPNWKDLLIAAVVAVAGRFAKDAKATGEGK
jgi:hypothetical protein